ncbi:hypothetical protein P2318_02910 [Myxococcaceae bacterium GXIMD 01537]
MSLRRALLSATVAVAVLSACALRPRYRDIVVPQEAAQTKPVEGEKVVLRVVDPETGKPIEGARVLALGGRARLAATSDAQGLVTVAVSRSLLDENPLVEVVLPKGQSHYRIEPVPPAPPAPPAPAAPTESDASGEPRPGSGDVSPVATDGGTEPDAGT